uniref:3-hydroxyacyl-CoA dehydrogenase n=1 Tax=Panagrellus redivivus TaxID=6233 RepID=A0A7E4WAW3_PANRE
MMWFLYIMDVVGVVFQVGNEIMIVMFSTPARAFSTSAVLNKSVNNVTIIGAGLMGSGIAQVTAAAKLNVNLVDSNEKALQKAQKGIQSSIARIAKKKHAGDEAAQKALVESVLSKITVSTNLPKAVEQSDLVIEAIVENIEVKRKLFAEIEANTSAQTLLATNTSSLKLIDIGANLKHKDRFGGLHFFNPVPVMKLLEVVRFDATSKETFDSLLAYGKAAGKTTVACKDTPGFIVNRLLVPYCFEALRLAERGDASKEDIDVAMKLGAGYPMGPFELSDYVGLDTLKFIMDGWVKDHPNDPTFNASESLNKLVKEGKLGRKTGEGFYKYN